MGLADLRQYSSACQEPLHLGERPPPPPLGVGGEIPPGVEGRWLGGSTVLPLGVAPRHPLPGRAGVLARCRDPVYEEQINRESL